jgi:hypothetical protein
MRKIYQRIILYSIVSGVIILGYIIFSNQYNDLTITSNAWLSHFSQIFTRETRPSTDVVLLESLKDILPIQPTTSGDIPVFVELLREARRLNDVAICNSFPEPKAQSFFFDDYSLLAPTLTQWQSYCKALVLEDPKLCQSADKGGHISLAGECQYVLGDILYQKNGSYEFCFEQFGNLYTSSDGVRNCFIEHRIVIEEMPEFYQELFDCLQRRDQGLYYGTEKNKCLYNLAQTTNLSKVCDLIGNTSPVVEFSSVNCKAELLEE